MTDAQLMAFYKEHDAPLYQMLGVDDQTIAAFMLKEMPLAIQKKDWQLWRALYDLHHTMQCQRSKVNLMNQLLLMQDHTNHQEITWEIQHLADSSSIPYIQQVLETGFDHLAYTCSEHQVIAKWFSHALASIGAREAKDLIRNYSTSKDKGVASEMMYRLRSIKQQRKYLSQHKIHARK